jgi:low temperature requirement protein LtrA
VNYSWFASAFDPDDIPFRLATFVQIAGSLVIAAGVPRAFEHRDYAVAVTGYVVVRLAFASQWLRVYRDNPPLRGLALRWGGGVLVVQLLWVLLQLWVHSSTPFEIGFFVLGIVELLVPYWAGSAGQMPFHPHHISERYGLFTLIVLGETVSAATVAIQEAMNVHEDGPELVLLALGGLLIVFVAWWIYFAHEAADLLGERAAQFLWGYGHYLIFASAASIGAGAEVDAAWTTGSEPISATLAAAAITVPTAVFLVMVWALQARHFKSSRGEQAIMPATAAAVLLCTFAGGYAAFPAGLCCAAAVLLGLYVQRFGPGAAEATESAATTTAATGSAPSEAG